MLKVLRFVANPGVSRILSSASLAYALLLHVAVIQSCNVTQGVLLLLAVRLRKTSRHASVHFHACCRCGRAGGRAGGRVPDSLVAWNVCKMGLGLKPAGLIPRRQNKFASVQASDSSYLPSIDCLAR